ncbi:MAG: hypothetical protein L0H79_20770 [Intrasporangium sp.]|uniref:hypothetical protein n=1 Tax=Intrasporangium sp. TaxID=1925024 RepID=UPI002648C167|nr:hypothetical protein [Intrasporangium sp.]MDN5798160.1 hypothetical protein [Intrasporangium sp.]
MTRVVDPRRVGAPEGALLGPAVAAVLGLGVGSLKNATYAGRYLPDGRTGSGRAWWWPATVDRYLQARRPAGTVPASQVAALLGLPLRKVYRLTGLRPVARVGNRPWWSLQEVLDYQASMPPADAVRVPEVAAALGVGPARVRTLGRTGWPPDGRDASGRLWWRRERLDELLGPARRRVLAGCARPRPGLQE